MTVPFRPMLAFDAQLPYYEKLLNEGPLWVSYKLDGIRCIVREGKLVSRTLKPIPNQFVQQKFSREWAEGFDGELIVGDPSGEGVFARTSSGVMSHAGTPNVVFHVFDVAAQHNDPYFKRFLFLQNVMGSVATLEKDLGVCFQVNLVEQVVVGSIAELEAFEEKAVELGYEGVIVRKPGAPYKQGRATPREGYMGKLKRFVDREAEIIGFEEMMHNGNPATTDSRGFTTRSSHKSGQRASGMLGTILVRDTAGPRWEFGIGSGFDHTTRRTIWARKEAYLGKIVKYKYLPVGMKDVPRHPVFLGFRDPIDMGSPA